MNRTIVFPLLVALASACASTPPEPAPPAEAKPPPAPLVLPRPIEEEPLPARASIWMTSVPDLRVGVRGIKVRQGIRALRAVAGDVELYEWPTLVKVAARVDVVSPNAYEPEADVDATATVHPAAPLAPGAYVLALHTRALDVDQVPGGGLTRLPDGGLGLRFEVPE
jgi:hypothetical protein